MTEFERIEKRFKELRDFLTERQAEDPDADRHDEGDGYNIARVDLHEIKLAFFALAQERDRLRKERDDVRREIVLLLNGCCSWSKLTQEIKKRGWECLKEDGKCSHG